MELINKLIAFLTVLFAMISNTLGITPEKKTDKVENFRVTSYITAETILDPAGLHSEDFDIITDAILFGCATFDSEGNVNLETEMLETALKNLRNAIGSRDVNITLNLLGPRGQTDSDVWEEQMEVQSVEHNKAFRSKDFQDNIIAVLDKYNFDGVHFDYEYPLSKKAWRNYNRFLASFGRKLGSDYTLGVATSDWNLQYTAAAINNIDTFELMLYDYLDAEGRHATYEDSVMRLEKARNYGIPAEKINMGLPFYARPSDLGAYWYEYKSYLNSLDENGWYNCPNTGKDFWFNTPDVIEEKTKYAIDNGFGGVMIWHYSCDLPSTDEASLLRAIGRAVNGA